MLCQTRVDKVPGAGVQGAEVIRVVVPGAWGYPCAVVPYVGILIAVMSGTRAPGRRVPGARVPGAGVSGARYLGPKCQGLGSSDPRTGVPGALVPGFGVSVSQVPGTTLYYYYTTDPRVDIALQLSPHIPWSNGPCSMKHYEIMLIPQ